MSDATDTMTRETLPAEGDAVVEKVRQRYAGIAASSSSCCGGGCSSPLADTREAAGRIGYSAAALESVPEAANLGLGCGAPIDLLALEPGETVLDLGSGPGLDAFLAAQRVGAGGRVIGVDMTPEMIDRARDAARQDGLSQVEFRQGRLEQLPVDDDSVDAVTSNCVINLVPDKRAAFSEIHRVLAPGGRFVISDIVTTGGLSDEVRADLSLWAECVSGAIDRAEYLGIIVEAGFADVEVITSHAYGDGAPTESITVRGFKR